MRNEMKPHYLTDGSKRQSILDFCMDMADGLWPRTFTNQSRALQSRIDQTETPRKYKMPSLILCDRDDALCSVERHQMLHELMPHATLEAVENAGHLPTLEQSEKTTAALLRWLEA